MKRVSELIILFGLMLLSSNCFALDDVIFGPEFTFTNFEPEGIKRAPRVIMRMYQHLVLGQPEGAKFKRETPPSLGMGEFVSPNGWWFHHHIEVDTIEIRATPGTPEYFRKYEADMQDAIFVSHANEEFFPALFRGGGHINFSSPTLSEDKLFFRNVIVDLLNNNELFMGAFGYDTHNAIPFQMLPATSIARFRKLIEEFDASGFTSHDTVVALAAKMYDAVSDPIADEYRLAWLPETGSTRGKFHAVNLMHVSKKPESRVEFRAVRPQASMDVWIRQITLLRDRINYVHQFRGPIPLRTRVPVRRLSVEEHKLTPPVDPQLALQAFYLFVGESGHKWSDHRDYLWPQWITDGELAKFEKSFWFKRKTCEQEFKKLFVRK